MAGHVHAVHVAPVRGEPVERIERATAVAGRGLEGDRYFAAEGSFSDREGSDLTLIEVETLEAVEDEYGIALESGVHRRNVTTTGVKLDQLVGSRFRLGGVRCEGVERCEPCSYLERHLERAGVREALVHRGGLRARILENGTITPGDRIEIESGVHVPE
ncbi:MOSC domain-containing protein [Natrarchaeobius halalkaliphilus]|uniref:MOSC domain-containing protein n=1 Tax=Natrarchaeobius halalkaliphilus TaxID=1679091 RepID=A0A3N6NZA0_9EURY|nr:MOSC domain-containing protein [Natrarchaeobius halalkaliphilus]RQG90249.1 MOSC domain-containing protein [Natrarchaeobius halalkaliphilus]